MATRRRNNDTRSAKGSSSSAGKDTLSGEQSATQPAAKRQTRSRGRSASKVVSTDAKGETRVAISPDERRAMIAQCAYLRAERRGFSPGYEDEDWLAAEREIDALLSAGHGASPQ